jgi:hypothetical protein
MLICPHCNHADNRLLQSRYVKDKNITRRRRECQNCKERYTTYEHISGSPFEIGFDISLFVCAVCGRHKNNTTRPQCYECVHKVSETAREKRKLRNQEYQRRCRLRKQQQQAGSQEPKATLVSCAECVHRAKYSDSCLLDLPEFKPKGKIECTYYTTKTPDPATP